MSASPFRWARAVAICLLGLLLTVPRPAEAGPHCRGDEHTSQAAFEAARASHPSVRPAGLRAAQAEARAAALTERREPLMLGLELEWMPGGHPVPGPVARVRQRLASTPQLQAAAQRAEAERDQALAEQRTTAADLQNEVSAWLLARERARHLTAALRHEEVALEAMRTTLEALVGLRRVDATALFAAGLLQSRLDERRDRLDATWHEAVAMLEAYTRDASIARGCLPADDPLLQLRSPEPPHDLASHPRLRSAEAAGQVAIAQAEEILQSRRNPLTWMAGAGFRPTMDAGLSPMIMVGIEGALTTRPRALEGLAEAEASGVAVAEAEREAIRWELERIVDVAQARWTAATHTYTRTLENELPLLEATLHTRIERIAAGEATAADVLTAHQALEEARTRAVEARFEALEAQRLTDWLRATAAQEDAP